MKMTGKMVMGGAMEAPFVVYRARPKNQRVEFTFQGMTGVQAFDGKSGSSWSIMPFMGKKDPEVMPAEESKMMAEEADFDGILVDWKDKGHKIESLGKEQVEGADCYKVKVTLKSIRVEDAGGDAGEAAGGVAFQVELELEGLVDRLDDLTERPQELLAGAGGIFAEGRADQGCSVSGEHGVELG